MPALADDAFAEFLARFRAALAEPDAQAVAALTRLPFLFESEWRADAEYRRIVPQLFAAPVRSCIARTEAIDEDDAKVIFCDPYAFYFRRDGTGAWQFVEFAADGEALP